MKKLLLTAALFSATFGYSQTNLIQNPTADIFTASTSDNADAFDMTPPSTIDGSNPTPYAWSNSDLDAYLDATYFVSTTDRTSVDEQPATTSDGADGSRGLKLTEDVDGNPTVSGSTRRIYQRVDNLSATTEYTFSVQTRSEASGVNTEVFILNEEITTEVGLDVADPTTDSRVDAFMLINNDFNSSNNGGTNFTTNTFTFTPSGSFVVVYMRALGAVDKATEVFVDNLSLIENTVLSTNDFTINGAEIGAGPVPMLETLNINGADVDSAVIYSLNGGIVAKGAQTVDVAGLASGIYVLEVTSGDETATTMVVK